MIGLHIFPFSLDSSSLSSTEKLSISSLDLDNKSSIYLRGQNFIKTKIDDREFVDSSGLVIKKEAYYWNPELSEENLLNKTFNLSFQNLFQ